MLTPTTEATCRECGKGFLRLRPLQAVCNYRCAKKAAQTARKAASKALRARKEALKTKREWLAEAREVAQRYARVRDLADGCISCDKGPSWGGQWHGSHFRSVGAASAVCLNLWNIHKACSICNNHLSGNLSAFEPRLRAKIGDAKVDWLRSQNQVVRYSPEYLKRYKRVIGKRANRLAKREQKAQDSV